MCKLIIVQCKHASYNLNLRVHVYENVVARLAFNSEEALNALGEERVDPISTVLRQCFALCEKTWLRRVGPFVI